MDLSREIQVESVNFSSAKTSAQLLIHLARYPLSHKGHPQRLVGGPSRLHCVGLLAALMFSSSKAENPRIFSGPRAATITMLSNRRNLLLLTTMAGINFKAGAKLELSVHSPDHQLQTFARVACSAPERARLNANWRKLRSIRLLITLSPAIRDFDHNWKNCRLTPSYESSIDTYKVEDLTSSHDFSSLHTFITKLAITRKRH
jgi:hypothetical protein